MQQVADHWITINDLGQDLRDATLDLQGQVASLSNEVDNEVVGILAQIDFLALEISSQTPWLEEIETAASVLADQLSGLEIRASALELSFSDLELVNTVPVEACNTGVDENTSSPWVVCEIKEESAWVSADSSGTYSADQICQSIGFSGMDRFGTTGGSVCGWYQGLTSSCNNTGSRVYNNNGLHDDTPGDRVLGLALSVHWTCE
jgi:hypothetical protein